MTTHHSEIRPTAFANKLKAQRLWQKRGTQWFKIQNNSKLLK